MRMTGRGEPGPRFLDLEEGDDAGVGAGPLGVDGLELGSVGVDGVLGVGDGGRVGPDGGVLEDLDAGVVGGHAGVERVGAVGAVGGGEVALEVEHVAGLDVGGDVGAGVLAVEGVGGADDHVDVADADDGVDGDELDVVGGGVADRGAQAGGGLGVDDDGLGALVDEVLDLLVLQAGAGGRQQRAEQLDVHLRGVLLLVVDVGGPERGVVVGQVDPDRDLARRRRRGRRRGRRWRTSPRCRSRWCWGRWRNCRWNCRPPPAGRRRPGPPCRAHASSYSHGSPR